MSKLFRFVMTLSVAAAFVAAASSAEAQFSKDGAKCRSQVAKNASKYVGTVAKTLAGCHKDRLKNGSGDCSTVSAADTKSKASKTAQKFRDAIGGAKDKCAGEDPNALLYQSCPAGIGPNDCSASIASFADVSDCLICLIDDTAAELSVEVLGAPVVANIDKDLSKCHQTIGKSFSKQLSSIVKDVIGCQGKAEKAGEDTVDNCTVTSFPSAKAQKAIDQTRDKVADKCVSGALIDLDSCDSTQFDLADCVRDLTTAAGQQLATQALELELVVVTTTTTTSSTTTTSMGATTTTTLAPQDPNCPDRGSLVILPAVSSTVCANNGDCDAPRTCDSGLGVCTSVSDLDTGRSGLAHDSDINEDVLTRGFLNCPGPSPTCGECTVTGIDPSTNTCRCSNDNRTICDEPFAADADDCGGATCDCFFGPPLPLSSGGTAACVLNRFANNVTGTTNIDLGAGAITANLRSVVYLGVNGITPCPYCGGVCSGDGSIDCATDVGCQFSCDSLLCNGGPNDGMACTVDGDCSAGTCSGLDPTPNDLVRGGTCKGAGTANLGQSCDAMAFNTSFPSNGGGWHSLDCIPSVGSNVSGQGLQITLNTTTGTAPPLTASVPCGGFFGSQDCHCRVCRDLSNLDTSVSCNTDTDCTDVGLKDCAGGQASPTNGCADSNNCVAGGGDNPDGACSDRTSSFCDGFLRANGEGILACTSNADCSSVSSQAGACSLSIPTPCFPPTVTAQGTEDPNFPVAVASFCVPPSASAGINGAAGLPGPGRAVQQAEGRTFCFSDLSKQYTPGVGCPAP